ncbi:hypothetical protein [Jeongeupia sp. USM3]|uniref:hypothetical protein n=1 Tax=Jeongeupia sp. USM3 TaxID=1906741 RepID=UPI00089E0160|nr:hypothetical protein [Jeongeupia sp. USM3]AOX99363.1 hypothetical protein BJP62_02165 [Jeongeupia sp. USM3]
MKKRNILKTAAALAAAHITTLAFAASVPISDGPVTQAFVTCLRAIPASVDPASKEYARKAIPCYRTAKQDAIAYGRQHKLSEKQLAELWLKASADNGTMEDAWTLGDDTVEPAQFFISYVELSVQAQKPD